jgi:hypothetical protein
MVRFLLVLAWALREVFKLDKDSFALNCTCRCGFGMAYRAAPAACSARLDSL